MKSATKISLTIVLIIVLAIAAAVVYVVTNLDYIVERVIEQEGSKVTRTEVAVDKVRIGLREGSASIAGISVANPAGFETPQAFSLNEISTRIDIGSLRGSPIVIDHVTIDAPAVSFEMNEQRKINLNELKKNIASAGGAKTAAQQETAEPSQVKLRIRRVNLKGGTITARLAPLEDKTHQLRLPPLQLTDLGGEQGATPAQITREIMDKLIARAQAEVKKQSWAKQLDAYKQQAEQRLEQEKQKLEQRKQDLKSEADKQVEQEKQKAEDKLKNLLGQ